MLRVAYLNSEYPSLSHTFIEREVQDVRRRGVEVHTFSIRPAPANGLLSEAHTHEASSTCVLKVSAGSLLLSGLRTLFRRPIGLTRGLVRAQRLAQPGIRSRLWHIGYLLEGARLVEQLNQRGLKHVHVHMANNAASVALLACAIDPSINYSMTVHGSAEFFAVEEMRLVEKVRNALFVRVISLFCRAQLMAFCEPALWDRLHVIHCGVDLNNFVPRHGANDPAVTTAPVAPVGRPKLRILTIGRLHPIKGYPQLLEACGLLSQRGVDWSWDIVGDGELRRELEERVRGLGFEHRVRFSGPVGQDDIQTHFDDADVLVVSSFMEGVPVVLMEAMAKELAVLSTRVGGVPELIDDGQEGLLTAPGSASGLAQSMERLARDPALRRRLGRAARVKIASEFNLATTGQRIVSLFSQSLLNVQEPARVSDKPDASRRYVLVTPCRNEAEYAHRTLDSVTGQSVPPALWVIVDDGSNDQTPEILARYAARFPYIRVVRREDRGKRSVGPGVIEAFNHGLAGVDLNDFDYVCKLDLDLDLPPRYFEILMQRMEANPRLGTCSGKAYFLGANDRLISEGCGDEASVGMTKFYRVECFRDIGGFVQQVMWDGIDCHRCRMLGWVARSWDEPDLRFVHLRPMGSSHKGIWTGRLRHGFGQYFMGTSLAYMTASAIFRMTRPPLVVGGLAMWWGYVRSMFKGERRYDDMEFRRFLREYQRNCLLKGKARATEELNARAAAWFKPPRQRGAQPAVPQDTVASGKAAPQS